MTVAADGVQMAGSGGLIWWAGMMVADGKMARSAIMPNVYLIGGAIFLVLAAVTVIAGFIVGRH